MTEILTLEQVLADAREEANTLRGAGHGGQADYIDRLLDAVQESAHDYLTWVNETEAKLRTARPVAWLRGRWPGWRRDGNARLGRDGGREYRLIVLPRRADVAGARAAGKRAAEDDRSAA